MQNKSQVHLNLLIITLYFTLKKLYAVKFKKKIQIIYLLLSRFTDNVYARELFLKNLFKSRPIHVSRKRFY